MPRIILNLFFIIMSLIKAFYIVAVFMHMKYERKAMQLTVLLPTLFLVWAIIAFLWEGGAWLENRSIWF
jgi:cytochrome c oxidase subunit IV